MGSYEIKSIADINGDKVKDICISCNGGGNAVSWSEIYEYKDKEYSMLIAIQQDDSPLEEVNTNLSIDEIIDLLYEKCNFNRDTVKLKVPKEGSVSKVYFILNLCAKFSLKSQPSIYGKYGKWIL